LQLLAVVQGYLAHKNPPPRRTLAVLDGDVAGAPGEGGLWIRGFCFAPFGVDTFFFITPNTGP